MSKVRKTTALAKNPRPGPDTPLVHRRPENPLAGYFPTEPASVSSGVVIPTQYRVGLQPLDIGVMPPKIHPGMAPRTL